MSGELQSYLRGLDLNTPNAQELINWNCKLTLCPRERDGGGGQPPVKSEVRAQSNKVGRLWFFGGKMLENIRGDSRGSIPPLRMPSLLPHDLCHEWNVSRRLPAVLHLKNPFFVFSKALFF